MGPEDAALRKKWMDAYICSGGAYQVVAPTGKTPGGRPPCPPRPTLEIFDMKLGAVVSSAKHDKIVGQKVLLLARSKPVGHAVTNVQWTIPGERIKNYTQSVGAGTRTELSAPDLQKVSIEFYWIGGGCQTVQVSAQVDGVAQTASATFKVLRPTMDRFKITTSSVSVMTDHFASPGNPVLGAYQGTPPPARFGCQWDAKVTTTAGGAGQIAFTQKILVNRTWTNNAGVARHYTSGGVLVLDDGLGIQYDGPQPISAGGSATLDGWKYADSPWIPLSASDRSASASERFELYLMYKPSGGDSIWVTLGMAEWSWAGATTRIGAPASVANNWNPATGAALTPAGSGSGTDSTQLPTWTGSFSSSTWS